MLAVDADYDAGHLLLRVHGDLDLAGAPTFRQATLRALSEPPLDQPLREAVVDLSGCDHVDSVGVGLLLGVLKRARQAGGSLTIICDEPRIRRVLELTGVDRIVPVLGELGPRAESATGVD